MSIELIFVLQMYNTTSINSIDIKLKYFHHQRRRTDVYRKLSTHTKHAQCNKLSGTNIESGCEIEMVSENNKTSEGGQWMENYKSPGLDRIFSAMLKKTKHLVIPMAAIRVFNPVFDLSKNSCDPYKGGTQRHTRQGV